MPTPPTEILKCSKPTCRPPPPANRGLTNGGGSLTPPTGGPGYCISSRSCPFSMAGRSPMVSRTVTGRSGAPTVCAEPGGWVGVWVCERGGECATLCPLSCWGAAGHAGTTLPAWGWLASACHHRHLCARPRSTPCRSGTAAQGWPVPPQQAQQRQLPGAVPWAVPAAPPCTAPRPAG